MSIVTDERQGVLPAGLASELIVIHNDLQKPAIHKEMEEEGVALALHHIQD